MSKKISITNNLRKPSRKFHYGTAGYRTNSSDLINVLSRASFIAYLRSCSFGGKRVGVMITASHNPADYNGIKIIDHNGNMLDKAWEKCSDELVNCEDKDFCNMLNKILRKNSNLMSIDEGIVGRVSIGRDTRDSGLEICESIKNVLLQVNCVVEDYGIVSTPEMHYIIRTSNGQSDKVSTDSYMKHMTTSYNILKSLTKTDMPILVDTANGVVAPKIKELGMQNINDTNGVLNYKCGADFVKTQMQAPIVGFNYQQTDSSTLYASLDGDADRLVFFTLGSQFTLIDGDAQAIILANFIKRQLESIKLRLNIGVVLSYYSNGGAFDALKSFQTEMVQTGVKNFVKAAKKYDIGIFFEPNGHGSVIFSHSAVEKIDQGDTDCHKILKTLASMFDPCVGDGLANLLVFKCILKSSSNLKPYNESGNRLLSVTIQNKNVLTVNDQNVVLCPKFLQEKIDEEVNKCGGRAFVRPSGTEDLVRVYAESPDQKDADLLCLKVAQLVYDMCGGVGCHPEIDFS